MYSDLLKILLLLLFSAESAFSQSQYVSHSLLRAYKSVLNAEVNGIIKRERQSAQNRNHYYSADDKQAPVNKNINDKQSSAGRVAKLSDLPLGHRNTKVGPARSNSNKELRKVGWESF